MSSDLLTEASAINAIYNPSTILPGSSSSSGTRTTYTLTIPAADQISLLLSFPATYPALPPTIDGTASVGPHAKKGSGQRVLDLARTVLSEVWREGDVVLYDLVEQLGERLASESGIDLEDVRQKGDGDKTHYDSDGSRIITGGIKDEGAAPDTNHPSEQQQQQQPQQQLPTGPPIPNEHAHPLEAPPEWTLSQPLTIRKSIFLARACPVRSPTHASACLEHLLEHDKQAKKATHNISAYRIRSLSPPPSSLAPTSTTTATTATTNTRTVNGTDNTAGSAASKTKRRTVDKEKEKEKETKGPMASATAGTGTGITYQDYDDDGEDAAGGRLLKLLQLMGCWNVLVVVSRWYGGVKLGPARFGVICGVAREALVEGGFFGVG